MRTIKFLLPITFIFFTFQWGKAQKILQPKGSLRTDLMLPLTTSNLTYKRFLDGLVDFSFGYQHNVFKGMYLGGGAHYYYAQIDPFALNSDVKGGLHYTGAYGKLGYEKFLSEKFAIDFGVKGGYTYLFSVNDSCATSYQSHFPFIQTQLSLTLMASEKSGFSLSIAYNHYFDNFRPEYVCFDSFSGYTPSNYAGISQTLSIGFSYVYYFNFD